MSEPTYADWIRLKIRTITEDFRAGLGYGDIYESSFLCYLECLVASRGTDPDGMWEAWKTRIAEVTPAGQPLVAFNRHLGADREALVQELERFKTRWSDGPSVRATIQVENLVSPPVKAELPKLDTGRPEKPGKKKVKPEPLAQSDVFGLFGSSDD